MTSPRARVLLVDDDRSFLGIITDTLREGGYSVDATSDPAEALRRAEAAAYDVALLDLVMPSMTGLELGDRIKAASPDTEVLILTGHADLDSAIQGIKHRVFDYLEKTNLDTARLDKVIKDATERSRLTRANRELQERVAEMNRRLQALVDVSARLAAEPHQDRVLQTLVRAAGELMRSEASRALIFARTHGEGWVIEAGAGEGVEAVRGARLQASEGLARAAAESGQPVVAAIAKQDPRYSPRCDDMRTRLPGYLAAPMRLGAVTGALVVAGRSEGEYSVEDQQLLFALARQGAAALQNALAQEQSVNFFTHVSDILISCLETMDVFYPGHSRGTAALADMVTRRLGLSGAERRSVHYAALLHDIGKVMVDPVVLRSTGPIDEAGRRAMREHPALGMQILKPITLWEDILPMIHSHHERWDGDGYPLGQKGEEIPLGARVIAVAESFDAMTRVTPHGKNRSPDEGLTELEACAGTQFDPRIVRFFVAEYRARRHQIPAS
ncbi:MAG TPA: HD domain-containing phosphohydrolase [Vicinamibacteria bacterium]